MNKVFLLGHLGRDPESWTTAGGQAMSKFSLATTERHKDKYTGETKERTQWHTIIAWGKLAEICNRYLRKGSHIYAEGRLTYRQWEDQNGNKKTAAEIRLENMRMLNRKQENHDAFDHDRYGQGDEDIPF